MNDDDKKRRNSLLCTLAFAGGHTIRDVDTDGVWIEFK